MIKKIIVLTLLLLPAVLYAEPKIDFYIGDKLYGSMLYSEFNELYKSGLEYKREITAEKGKRVYAIIEQSEVSLKDSSETILDIHIVWKDAKGKEFKKVYTNVTLKSNAKKVNKWMQKYEDVAKIGFPATSLFILLLLLI